MISDYNLGSNLDVDTPTSEEITVASGDQALNHYASYVNLFQLGDLTSFLDKCDYFFSHQDDANLNALQSRSPVEDYISVKNMAQSYFGIYQA